MDDSPAPPDPAGPTDPESPGRSLVEALESPRASRPPVALLAALEGQVLACVIEGAAPSRSAFPEAGIFETDGVGRTALAFDLPAPATLHLQTLLDRLAAACPPPARAGVALAAGAVNARGVLGVAPDLALAVLARQASPGLYLDAGLRSAAGRPLGAAGRDLRWPARAPAGGRRAVLVGGLLAAALVLVALGPVILGPTPPHGAVTLLAASAAANRARGAAGAPGMLTLAEGDEVEAVVTAEPGTYVTLLVLDSTDQWVLPLPGPDGVNVPRSPLRQRWALDDQPGMEEILAVVARTPWPDPLGTLAALNALPAPSRADRHAQLAVVLDESLGSGVWSVARGAQIRHVRR
jgi:hypothetical protein